ncbi:MAG: hypothetical protein R2873_05165 [Caldilineaceae bacterium]
MPHKEDHAQWAPMPTVACAASLPIGWKRARSTSWRDHRDLAAVGAVKLDQLRFLGRRGRDQVIGHMRNIGFTVDALVRREFAGVP